MKMIIATALVMSSLTAFAEAPAGHEAAATPAPAAAAPEAKKGRKEARMECLKDNSALRGKELMKCIKSKLH